MSISMLVEENTVGRLRVHWECIIVEEEKNLFPKSLTGTTIQDGGTRERRELSYMISHYTSLPKFKIKKKLETQKIK